MTDKIKNDMTKEQTTDQSPDIDVTPVQLSIQDLQAAASVIDLASRRGAFHAKEMATVGTVFNKLQAFLEYVASQQPAEEEKEAEKETK